LNFFSYCQKLHEVPKTGRDPKLMKTILPKWFLGHIICAAWPSEADSACQGDSGGPITKFSNNTYPHFVQIGNIFSLKNWIVFFELDIIK